MFRLTKHYTSPNINSMRRNKKLLVFLLSGIIVVLLAIIGILIWKYQQANVDEASKNQETSERIIEKVSRIYVVPANEEPTVALIQDKSKLGNQEFFKETKNGDYLLIYKKGKIAMVYREEVDKLVNVGPVNLEASNNQQQGQTAGDQTGNRTP